MNFFARHITWGVYETFSYREVYKGLKDLWKGNLIEGNEIKQFEEEFARFLGVKCAYSFGAGRMALYNILKAMQKQIMKQKGKGISINAFNILSGDIKSLISKLSP